MTAAMRRTATPAETPLAIAVRLDLQFSDVHAYGDDFEEM